MYAVFAETPSSAATERHVSLKRTSDFRTFALLPMTSEFLLSFARPQAHRAILSLPFLVTTRRVVDLSVPISSIPE